MSYLALNSSAGVTAFDNYSTFLEFAYSARTHQFCSMNSHEFQPIFKSPAHVLGEQVVGPSLRRAWSIASYVYSKLPSFSLPVSAASAVPECAPSICLTPTGSYENSCHRPVVTYLADEDQCELTTRCATIYEGLPHQQTSIRFSPGDSGITLENRNGTLVVQRSREETINARLGELPTTAATPKALKKEEAAIIGDLTPGDVITISSDLKPTVISPEKWPKYNDGFSAFQRIAKATGGIVGYAPSADSLNPLLEKMSAHILKAAESSEFIDIAFVLDTTSSMQPYIAQVQKNLVQFFQQLQEMKKNKASTCRVALLEYRDKDDLFVNRVNTGFTSNLDQVQKAVSGLTTSGGGDVPEAVLDALLAAKNDLSWNSKAKRIVILIGDASPQPRTTDGFHDEAAVVAQYQTVNTQVAVYSVFAEKA
jgi:hypothetical protein